MFWNRNFPFNSYVYYLTRGLIDPNGDFNLLTHAFNLPTHAFNLATRAFSLLTRGFELVTRGFELVTRELDFVTRRFELVNRRFELVTRELELVTGGLELVTRNLCFTFPTDFCAAENSQGIFTHFHFIMFTQERISMYVDPWPQILQL